MMTAPSILGRVHASKELAVSDSHVDRVAALFDRVASDYDQHVPFFTAFARRLVEWTHVKAGQRVLDIGTGRGAVATAARAAGASVVAVDIAAEMLRLVDGDRLRADARSLPIRSAAFDAAIGAFSIHLLPDPVQGLKEAARSVRPGGRVVLAHGGRFTSADWDFWFETLARYAHRGTLESSLPAPTPISDHEGTFRALGLLEVRSVEAEIEVTVPDGETFLRGEYAHGARSFFDRLDQEARQELEAELLAGLHAMQQSGGIVLRRASWFTEGTAP